jgi:hypothetical protein
VDQSVVGRGYTVATPYQVSVERVREFVAATGAPFDVGDKPRVPPTFPIVLAFEAMNTFLVAESLELSRIVHGEQRFAYLRPVVLGDVLSANLTVTSLRQIAGNDIIGTTSEIRDDAGELVCTAGSTLVHRGVSA